MSNMILEKGVPFPSDLEFARIKQQQIWDDMYNGVYHYIRKVIVGDTGAAEKKQDPLIPLPGIISDIKSDLLFGEFPNFIFGKDTQSLNELVMEKLKGWKTFMTDVNSASIYNSALGTMFWYLFRMNDKVFYKFIKPMNTIWSEDIIGLTKVWFFHEIDRSRYDKWIEYHLQEHKYIWDAENESPLLDPDRKHVVVEYEFRVKNDPTREIKKIKIVKKEMETGLDFIPIIKLENKKNLNQKNGKSDYQGKEQMFAEVDNRIDQINNVLSEHEEPWLFIPPGVLNEKGQFNRSQGKMIEKSASDNKNNKVDIVTWDGKLEASFNAIKMWIQLILFTSRISNPIAGFFFDNTGGHAESGKALKWRSVNTNSMITGARNIWNETFLDFFTMWFKMDTDFKDAEAKDQRTLWRDGLPLDDEAIVTNVVKEVNAQLKSKLKGIQEINEVDEKTAQEELDRINAEADTKANRTANTFRTEV